jgi:hypothetical protein
VCEKAPNCSALADQKTKITKKDLLIIGGVRLKNNGEKVLDVSAPMVANECTTYLQCCCQFGSASVVNLLTRKVYGSGRIR